MKAENQENTVVRRYTFKLYPNRAQAAALERQAVLLAQLWNAALEQREIQWAHECQRKAKGERKGLGFYDQSAQLKQLRAENPEYAAMSSASLACCLEALDNAFKAFFKRAKGGAGKSSGYPRYKSPYAIEHKGTDCTIWHGARRVNQKPLSGCGWALEKAGKQWKLYAKGVPGKIRARGRFPAQPLDYRTMEIMRRGGVWQMSIVTKMEARRVAGAQAIEVDFDLIDEFARVKVRANGECLPGWEADFPSADERITPTVQGVNQGSGPATPETGGDGRFARAPLRNCLGPATPETGGDGRDPSLTSRDPSGPATPETGGDGRRSWSNCSESTGPATSETDAMQAHRDTRRKKFSYRWRQETKRIAKRKAREARRRKEALHRWTTALVRQSKDILVVAPPIKDSTRSARGTEKNPGAAVEPVASLNRHVLGQAPAMAIQILEYKAAEVGIPFARLTPDEHALQIGRDLPEATKAVRRLRRELNRGKEVA